MSNYIFDTIAAIATPWGKGGISIIKLSGEKSLSIASRIFKPNKEFKSHRVYHGKIYDCFNQQIIDEVILLYMKSPKSYTGEDVVEIQCHGGIYITKKILDLCLRLGARLAQKGEFTKRAFINGKLDLTQAEAITDLINSKISSSLNIACQQLEGKLSSPIKRIRQDLIDLLSSIEVCIDFPEDIEEIDKNNILNTLKKLQIEIKELLKTADIGKIYREGVTVGLIGRPNVGKSSLLNKFVNYERAIVTDIPGTTRDTLEEYININNIPVKIVDTAGIRETDNIIEKIGVSKTYDVIEEADLILLIIEADKGILPEEYELINKLTKPFIIVANKIDLLEYPNTIRMDNLQDKIVSISAKFGQGIIELEDKIVKTILNSIDTNEYVPINTRHKNLLYKALDNLENCFDTINNNFSLDLVTIDIKQAIISLGEITGEDVTEEVINNIFDNFCVGK